MTARRAILAGLVFGALAGPRPAEGQEKLVVVNSRSSEAAVIDPVTRQILAQLPTGPRPRQVAVSPDGRYAYVAGYGTSTLPTAETATVTVLDLVEGRVRSTYSPQYRNLHDVRVSPDGERLWLTAEADSGIVELDAATGTVLMLWKTGGAKSHTLVSTPNGRKLFVANKDSDSVTVINRLTVVAKRIATGAEPEGLDIAPNGRELWVANRGDHTVTVINARKDRPDTTMTSGGIEPVRLRFTPDGSEVWVSNWGSRTVTIFDRTSRELLATVAFEVRPWDIVFSADGGQAFVSAPERNEIHVVDTTTRLVGGSFFAGSEPLGMAWSSWGVGRTSPAAR